MPRGECSYEIILKVKSRHAKCYLEKRNRTINQGNFKAQYWKFRGAVKHSQVLNSGRRGDLEASRFQVFAKPSAGAFICRIRRNKRVLKLPVHFLFPILWRRAVNAGTTFITVIIITIIITLRPIHTFPPLLPRCVSGYAAIHLLKYSCFANRLPFILSTGSNHLKKCISLLSNIPSNYSTFFENSLTTSYLLLSFCCYVQVSVTHRTVGAST